MLASQYTERGGWTGYGYVIFLIFVDDSKWWISFFFFPLFISPIVPHLSQCCYHDNTPCVDRYNKHHI